MSLYQHTMGRVQELFPGDTLKLQEGGAWVDFVVAGKGLLGTAEGDALLVRKELLPPCTYFFASAEYEGSTPDRWLSYGYLNALQRAAQKALVPAALPCWDEFHKLSKTLVRRCFLLSATELGFVDESRVPVEGTAIPYFGEDSARAAQFVGSPAPYGTRTPMKASLGNSVHIISVGTTGEQLSHPVLLYTLPVRPALVLRGDVAWDMYRRVI